MLSLHNHAEKHYNADFLTEAKKLSINDDRADVFFTWILDSSNMIDLENTVRLVLILSHGNPKI